MREYPTWQRIKENFTSRKFLVLVIATIAFFRDPVSFPATYLVMSFCIYCGTNVAEKFITGKNIPGE